MPLLPQHHPDTFNRHLQCTPKIKAQPVKIFMDIHGNHGVFPTETEQAQVRFCSFNFRKVLQEFTGRQEWANQARHQFLECSVILLVLLFPSGRGFPPPFTELHILGQDPTDQISHAPAGQRSLGLFYLFWWIMSVHIGLSLIPLPRLGKETNLTSVLAVLIWIHCRKLMGERGATMLSVVWYFHLPAI